MAGLSSVMAITRPLGEVNLAAMNRCVGVYRLYLIGGGGGGGGYYSFNFWYGDSGNRGQYGSHTHRMTPPLTVLNGQGGSFSSNGEIDGIAGVQSVVSDNRGISITRNGGSGGTAAVIAKNASIQGTSGLWGKVTDRFSLIFSTDELPAPSFLTQTGSPGGSVSSGEDGGIIKAFRIG